MTVQPLDEEAIFHVARAMGSPAERTDYLAEACGDNQALRARVEGLLKIYADENSFAGMPSAILATVDHQPISERPGTVIGFYKLMEQIGEGGFGLVFVAEQQQPVRRKVALKVIKPGMDTRDVIARFEAERQALALMDHPNIARVFDAGATDSGRPYFVMELVRGIPITEYCDQQHLTPRERLELFVSLCHAIQHAHQKGIIHRDVKPTNVLVTEHDGRPVVKVIDFGVAKALSQQLTQHTIYTQFAQMIGTPLYMSPEQAAMSGLDIDTRSDIYSLGVLLYELLTGSTPFDRKRLHQAAADEIRRIIREEDPPRPSTRLSQSGDRLPSIAAQRNTEPAGLSKLVRGDLDWIVMKCLEKDRDRRYETANGLAQDIERHLHNEPVAARPQSAAYRFRKFARRNMVAMLLVSAASLTFLLLLAGLAVSNWLIAAERNEKAAAFEEAQAQRQRAEENLLRARMAVRDILFDAALGRGEWSQLPPALRANFTEKTVAFYQSLLQESSSDPSIQYETAVGYRSLGLLHISLKDFPQAEKFVRQSIPILESIATDYPQKVEYRQQLAYSHYVHGLALNRANKTGEAEIALRKSEQLYEALVIEKPELLGHLEEFINCEYQLVYLLQKTDRAGEAHEKLRQLHKSLKQFRPRPPQALIARQQFIESYRSVASRLTNAKQFKEAFVVANLTVEMAERLKTDLPDSPQSQQLLGRCLRERGAIYRNMTQYEEADKDLNRALEIFQKLTLQFPAVAEYQSDLGGCSKSVGLLKRKIGQIDQSVTMYREAVRLLPNDPEAHGSLGFSLWWQKNLPEAEATYRRALLLKPDNTGYRFELARVLTEVGKLAEAETEFRETLRRLPRDIHTLRFLGGVLWKQQKLSEAEAAYREALLVKPDFVICRVDLANLLAQQGKQSEFLKLMADDSDSYYSLGAALNREEKFDEAVAALRKAIELKSDNANAYHALGIVLGRQGKEDEAIAAYRKSIEVQPDYFNSYFNISFIFRDQGKLDEAVAILRKAVEIGPDIEQCHHNLGNVLYLQEQYDEAVAAHRKAVELRPDVAEFQVKLGSALRAQGKSEEADAVWQKAIALEPDNAETMMELAVNYRLAGRQEEADRLVEDAAAKCFEHGQYANAFRLARAGNAELMDSILKKLIAQNHEKAADGTDLIVLGELRLVAGEFEAATVAIRAAIARNDRKYFMHKSLGWALLAQGQPDAAKEAFEHVLAPLKKEDGTYNLVRADADRMTCAYFLDLVTEDEYVNHLKSRKSLACYPWFYVGQRKEIEGHREAAIAAYKRCLELGQDEKTVNPVRWLAKWRLELLGNKPD